MSTYEWLLFDADGTLLDYDAAEAYALKSVVEHFGFPFQDDIRDRYHRINSSFWKLLEKGEIRSEELRVRRFDALAEDLGWDLDADEFSRIYLERLGSAGFMIEGARDMLDRLPSGLHKAIITNGIRDTQYGRLTDAGILGLFDEIIISEEAGAAKPSSVFFDHTLERIGSRNLSRMLVIGDSLSSDIAGGAGYGIDTCWYNPAGLDNPTEHKPVFEIRDWEGLFRLLNR